MGGTVAGPTCEIEVSEVDGRYKLEISWTRGATVRGKGSKTEFFESKEEVREFLEKFEVKVAVPFDQCRARFLKILKKQT
jgi:hypothetical protein